MKTGPKYGLKLLENLYGTPFPIRSVQTPYRPHVAPGVLFQTGPSELWWVEPTAVLDPAQIYQLPRITRLTWRHPVGDLHALDFSLFTPLHHPDAVTLSPRTSAALLRSEIVSQLRVHLLNPNPLEPHKLKGHIQNQILGALNAIPLETVVVKAQIAELAYQYLVERELIHSAKSMKVLDIKRPYAYFYGNAGYFLLIRKGEPVRRGHTANHKKVLNILSKSPKDATHALGRLVRWSSDSE